MSTGKVTMLRDLVKRWRDDAEKYDVAARDDANPASRAVDRTCAITLHSCANQLEIVLGGDQ